MQVETYEVESVEQSEMQALAAEGEALELIESLGLEGQKSLVNKDTGSILPYRFITKQERFVFKTLFPQECKIEEYKDGPIPLRVLQAVAHVKSLAREDMAYIQVWYPRQGIDDPVLVARPNSYRDPVYLLARWGQALLPFEELLEKAIKEQKAIVKAKLAKMKHEVDAAMATLDSYVEGKAAEGDIPSPYFQL
jgi:hypothetical protein